MQKLTKRGWSDKLGLPYEEVSQVIDTLLEQGYAKAHFGPAARKRKSFYSSPVLEMKLQDKSGGVTVEANRVVTVPGDQTQKETDMSNGTGNGTQSVINFTLDLKAIGNLAAQDPLAYRDLVEGVNEARAGNYLPTTTKIGAANLTGGEGEEADWYGCFLGTDQSKKPGEAGMLYRNSKGKNDRIQARLKRQPKNQQLQNRGNQSLGQGLPPVAPTPVVSGFSPAEVQKALEVMRAAAAQNPQQQQAQIGGAAQVQAAPDMSSVLPKL